MWQFFSKVLIIIHVLNSLHFIQNYGLKEYPLMMFQACLNPSNYYSLNGFSLMPFDQFLLYSYCVVYISSNFYLYKFLNLQNEKNKAKKESNVIREASINAKIVNEDFLYFLLFSRIPG